MKNAAFVSVFVLLSFLNLKAQTDTTQGKWTKGGMGGITFSQTALSNWAAGGNSTMTFIGNLNLFANHKKGTTAWDNSLDLAYGFLKNYFFGNFKIPVTKAEDKIDFNSKFGKKAWSEKAFYTAFLNFRTQFAAGYQKPGDSLYISKFLAPAYLQFGLGIDLKPKDWVSIQLAPVSGKITIVNDDYLAGQKAFGVNTYMPDDSTRFTPGNSKYVRAELGATILVKAKHDLMKNVGWESTLNLFSNYVYQPQFVDVRWTNNIVAKINKYLSANLVTDMIYDHDILIPLINSDGTPKMDPLTNTQLKGRKLQIKEIFGVGLSYKF